MVNEGKGNLSKPKSQILHLSADLKLRKGMYL